VNTIETSATVTIERDGDGWRITSSHLETAADIEGVSEEEFEQVAEQVKVKCPVSKALNIEISLDAKLKDLKNSSDSQRTDQSSPNQQKLYKNSWVESSD
jgi:hypothetical protein